jgi:hypothetical protein
MDAIRNYSIHTKNFLLLLTTNRFKEVPTGSGILQMVSRYTKWFSIVYTVPVYSKWFQEVPSSQLSYLSNDTLGTRIRTEFEATQGSKLN